MTKDAKDRIIYLTTPLTVDKRVRLQAGDRVLLSGEIYTARDAAHKRLLDQISKVQPLPFALQDQVIYYVGPAPARPGRVIGPAGPTTSYRMDRYTPELLDRGLSGMIGKGDRSFEVVSAMKRNQAVYFCATGGAAALLAQSIVRSEIIAYEDLGPEAIRVLTVREMPLIVAIDAYGNNLYEEGIRQFSQE